MKLGILDDHVYFQQQLQSQLRSMCEVGDSIVLFSAVKEVERLLERDAHALDVLFLDIMLEDDNGIGFGKRLEKDFPHLIIVFISSDATFFKTVYEVPHLWFLTKPIVADELEQVMHRIQKSMEQQCLHYSVRGNAKRVPFSQILCLENELKRTRLHLEDKSEAVVPCPLRELEPQLSPKLFVRTHKSFFVNMTHWREICAGKLVLDNDFSVPVSRRFEKQVKDYITQSLGGLLV